MPSHMPFSSALKKQIQNTHFLFIKLHSKVLAILLFSSINDSKNAENVLRFEENELKNVYESSRSSTPLYEGKDKE